MGKREFGLIPGARTILLFVVMFGLPLVNFGGTVPPGAIESASQSYTDALLSPDLPAQSSRTLGEALAPSSLSPSYSETSEYLIGKVAVGVVLLESNGTKDASTENWTSQRESEVTSKIQSGLSWLAKYNSNAHVSFVYDIHYKVLTSYEPINRPSTDQYLWINEAMTNLGYPGTYYFDQVRDYANNIREKLGTDWAFTIFVVDSLNDPDGCFTDSIDAKSKYFAYAYLGGPFLVMTYDNDGCGIWDMDHVVAHETAHIFYATDEHNDIPEYSGYLNVQDNDGAYCLMNSPFLGIFPIWTICPATKGQLGWRDTDSDGIQDIIDTFPDTVLSPYSPDPTSQSVLTYSGSVSEIPYPNSNPYGTGRDITINTITNVEFRVGGGAWQNATSKDGAFDEAEESFVFTTPSLSEGMHIVETRGVNSVGNVELTYASDTITVVRGLLTVTAPNGGESWVRGATRTITWLKSGSTGSYVKIELLKSGVVNRVISSSTANVGSYSWPISSTQTLGTDYKIRITSTSYSSVSDSSDGNFAITAGALTVKSPNGGEKWVRGSTRSITWSSSGSPGSYVKIELMKSGVLNKVIVSSTANDGSYSWTISSTQTLGTDYKIRITSTSKPAITDSSNSNFAIVRGTLTVTSPNGGESWKHGTAHTITWSKSGSTGSYVKIELLKGGVVNRVITSSTANDGSYSWTIPSTQTLGTDYKIRITSTTYSSISDSSNSNFYITT